jgi:uncharacterized protein YhbP (UPF0306 family)
MRLPGEVRAFLDAHTTLTLATVNDDGTSYACDLFYVRVGNAFYFLSDPKTRHVQNLRRAPRVTATIHGETRGWQEIRGVQIAGIAQRVANRAERARAFAAYVRRYAFVRTLIPRVTMLGRAHKIFGVVELYKIVPRWVRWIDNTQGFGHKVEFKIAA